MTTHRQRVGRRGEAAAADRLAAQGWVILERNWRCARGEIDIVARDGEWLVIVEVRTRTGHRYGSPEESVDHRKQARLVRLGQTYKQAVGWRGPWRIDVVAVMLGQDDRVTRFDHYPGAVS